MSRIRRGTIGASLATFAAVWAAIFFQLVSGHDPALSKASTAQPAASNSSSNSSSSDDYDSYGYPDSTTTAPSAPLGSVTTQQS